MTEQQQKKAHREPMVWLVVALPAAVVVAGLVTLGISIKHRDGGEVRDEVSRMGRVLQETDLGPDEQARKLGLTALLRERDGRVEVVPMAGQWQRQDPLKLLAEHPTDSARDRMLELTPQPGGNWLSSVPFEDERSHDWKFVLSDRGDSWRLRARMPRDQMSAVLTPALGE
ncbi:nitrogen fixation protein FixH [Lysobacter pythonis]|uniref:Nitrogen fixation protein FixH n=1 Tax=Solilutibacter pythonis TaxID=2483112 RepID=A0A3M2HVR8_9GAMM|nr:FixH family protein [Lysobacter pythonis]RMH93841.1 nitrogen fixation protein FixH [Lysobacter pythonis]